MTDAPNKTAKWPEYDTPIADAGQAYIESVALNGRHTLPAMFRWHEFWDVINEAAAREVQS